MNKKKYLLAGVAVAFASVALLIVTAKHRPKRKWVFVGLILAAIAGFVGAVALAYHPRKEARKRLKIEQLIDDFDAEQLEENISEVLGDVSDAILH